jgi:hypothetical protein
LSADNNIIIDYLYEDNGGGTEIWAFMDIHN